MVFIIDFVLVKICDEIVGCGGFLWFFGVVSGVLVLVVVFFVV